MLPRSVNPLPAGLYHLQATGTTIVLDNSDVEFPEVYNQRPENPHALAAVEVGGQTRPSLAYMQGDEQYLYDVLDDGTWTERRTDRTRGLVTMASGKWTREDAPAAPVAAQSPAQPKAEPPKVADEPKAAAAPPKAVEEPKADVEPPNKPTKPPPKGPFRPFRDRFLRN